MKLDTSLSVPPVSVFVCIAYVGMEEVGSQSITGVSVSLGTVGDGAETTVTNTMSQTQLQGDKPIIVLGDAVDVEVSECS